MDEDAMEEKTGSQPDVEVVMENVGDECLLSEYLWLVWLLISLSGCMVGVRADSGRAGGGGTSINPVGTTSSESANDERFR